MHIGLTVGNSASIPYVVAMMQGVFLNLEYLNFSDIITVVIRPFFNLLVLQI